MYRNYNVYTRFRFIVKKIPIPIAFDLKMLFVLSCVGLLILAYVFPFYYQFRFTVALISQILSLAVLVYAGFNVVRFTLEYELTWLIELGELLREHYQIALPLASIVRLVISYFISVRSFSRKDLP